VAEEGVFRGKVLEVILGVEID
jgi:hypothetical protein